MDDTTWSLVAEQRRSLADLLAGLTSAQWEAPSLCSEWRVRDVAAHVAMTPAPAPGLPEMLRTMSRTRGLWAAGREVAVAYAVRPYEQIVDEMRRRAESRERPVFNQPANILPDLLVHGQDIAIPLGLVRDVPPDAGAAGLRRIWGMGWPFHARRRLAGVRAEAVDCEWAAGDGPVVAGSAADLLLLATGRAVALDRLTGPGVAVLRRSDAGRPVGGRRALAAGSR